MDPFPWFPVVAIATLGIVVGVPIALTFYYLFRRRTHPIRQREYPAWEHWLARRYPKATKDETAVIRQVVEIFAHLARVEPAQLLPEDRIVGFVLQPTWMASLDPESDYGGLYDELAGMLEWRLTEQDIESFESWVTVGDAIDFMVERLCRDPKECTMPETSSIHATAVK